MKKLCVLVAGAVLAASVVPAWAIPPFNDAFKKMYVKEGSPLADKVGEAKCNVCHGKNAEGKDDKKVKNEYGKAVGKYLKKADYTGDDKKYPDVKADDAQKALAEGLASAGKEKSSTGKTFDEIIKSGELPAK